MAGPLNAPIDDLFLNLALSHSGCANQFDLARLANEPNRRAAMIEADQCQSAQTEKGNAAIVKMASETKKPAVQAALKELALFWRLQMANIGQPRSTEAEVQIIRMLKTYTERVRIEADW